MSSTVFQFQSVGVLTAAAGKAFVVAPYGGTIKKIAARVGATSAGSSILVDINKNGTTIFTTQANRPTIAAASVVATLAGTPEVLTFAAGDLLSVDIDQIGSGTAGSNLGVAVLVELDEEETTPITIVPDNRFG
jgi:predicted aconitase with swiveling domain